MIQLQFLNYILNTKDNSLITLNNLDKKIFFSIYYRMGIYFKPFKRIW